MAIAAALTTFVALSFSKVNETEALDKNADLVVSVLTEARSMTLSSINGYSYGVHFDENQVVLFQGNVYNSTASTNFPTSLNSLVGIQNVSLVGGGNEVLFNKLTGATAQSGTLQVYLQSATTTYKTVTISPTGITEKN